MTDRDTLVKYLRGAAKYHRQRKTPVVVSWEFLRAIKACGVDLEYPGNGYPGEMTPDQADRYATQLEQVETAANG